MERTRRNKSEIPRNIFSTVSPKRLPKIIIKNPQNLTVLQNCRLKSFSNTEKNTIVWLNQVKSKYRNFPSETMQLFKNTPAYSPKNFRKKLKIRRLWNKMERISKISQYDNFPNEFSRNSVFQTYTNQASKVQTIYRPKTHIKNNSIQIARTPLLGLRSQQRVEKKISVTQDVKYTDEMLEKIINNDTSLYRDNKMTTRNELTLKSMKTTFLCSNYLRFQPLLNVFE